MTKVDLTIYLCIHFCMKFIGPTRRTSGLLFWNFDETLHCDKVDSQIENLKIL